MPALRPPRSRAALPSGFPAALDPASVLRAITESQAAFIGAAGAPRALGRLVEELVALTGSELGVIAEVVEASESEARVEVLALAVRPGAAPDFDLSPTRFVVHADTVFRRALRLGTPIIATGEELAPRAARMPPGHPPITSFLGLPLGVPGGRQAVAGLANRPGGYPQGLVDQLRPLTDAVTQMLAADALAARHAALVAELERRDAHTRVLLQKLPIPEYTHSGGVLRSANPACVALLRAKDEASLIGRHVLEFTTPSSRAVVAERAAWAVAGRAGLPPRGEVQLVALDGTLLDVEVNPIEVSAGPEGAPVVTTALVDLTERRAAERALAAQAAVLQRVLDHSPLGIWHVDESGRVALVNPAFPLSAAAARGEGPLDYAGRLAGEEARRWREADRAALAEPGPVTRVERLRLADGQEHEIEVVRARFTGEDGRAQLIGLCADVSDRRRTERRLHQLAAVFENAHEAIVITQLDGTILEVNRRFCQVTGYSAAEAVGQTPRLLRSGRHDAAFYRTIFETVGRDGHWHGEIWNRRKNGDVYPEWLSITSLRGPEGPFGYVALFTDLSDIKAQQARLAHLAYHDGLTGLPNRALFGERMRAAEERAVRTDTLVGVGYLDLDGFKAINDVHGHAVGDRLLIEVSRRLERSLRTEDTVARFGGDEFVMLVVGYTRMEELDRTFARVLHSIAEPFVVEGHTLALTASVGVTVFPEDNADPDTQLRHADRALHVAKETGKNRAHRFDLAHDRRGRARRESLRRLEEAVRDGELRLAYQPKVDLRTGEVMGVEALVRWAHPERGLLVPADFLLSAEGSPVDVSLGEWVIREALRQQAAWRAGGLELAVGVNISPHHLAQADFAARLGELLADHAPLPRGALELEILESAAFGDLDRVADTVQACADLGVEFALDDFGTGYSSLTYLRRLPVSTLKIDRSFTRDMLDDGDDLAIVEGVVGLARAFRRRVVAEGIEREEHGALLLQLGCEYGQGYGIARPMPPEEVPGWAAAWRAPASWNKAAHETFLGAESVQVVVAELDHRRWVREVEAYVNDESAAADRPPAVDPRQSRFGRWLTGVARERLGQEPAFAAVVAAHDAAVAVAAGLVAAVQVGDRAGARGGLAALTAARDRTVEALHALRVRLGG